MDGSIGIMVGDRGFSVKNAEQIAKEVLRLVEDIKVGKYKDSDF